MEHDLKTWPEAFDAVWRGAKSYEVRRDDRGFAVGDALVLREWIPGAEAYTGRVVRARVSYKSEGGTWGLPEGLCVMSLRDLEFCRAHDFGDERPPLRDESQERCGECDDLVSLCECN